MPEAVRAGPAPKRGEAKTTRNAVPQLGIRTHPTLTAKYQASRSGALVAGLFFLVILIRNRELHSLNPHREKLLLQFGFLQKANYETAESL